jgi:hypothetical protein
VARELVGVRLDDERIVCGGGTIGDAAGEREQQRD